MVDIIKQDMTDIWAVAGDVVAPDSAKVRAGWSVEAVPRQWWNWFENRQDTNIAYMLQKGIPEWDQFTEYLTNKSYVQRNNVVYKSILTGVNKDPVSQPTYWVKAFPESSAYLETIRPLAVVNNSIAYINNSGVATNSAITAFGRSVLNVADAAAARALDDSQQANSNLSALSAVVASTNALPYFTGTTTMGTTILTQAGRDVLAGVDYAAIRATLGLTSAAITQLQVGATERDISKIMRVGAFGLGSFLDLRTHIYATGIPSDCYSAGTVFGFVNGGVGGLAIPGLVGTVYGTLQVNGQYIDSSGLPAMSRIFTTVNGRVFTQTAASGSAWGTWAESWSTANLVKTISQTDNTVGRMLQVGDFGVGNAGVATTNLDTLPASANGFYKLNSPYTGSPIASTPVSVIHTCYDAERTQMAFYEGSVNPRIFVRKFRAAPTNAWGSWVELYHTGNTADIIAAVTAGIQPTLDAKVNKSGDTMTGQLAVPSVYAIGTGSNSGILYLKALGSTTSSGVDASISVDTPTSASEGGRMVLRAATMYLNGAMTVTGAAGFQSTVNASGTITGGGLSTAGSLVAGSGQINGALTATGITNFAGGVVRCNTGGVAILPTSGVAANAAVLSFYNLDGVTLRGAVYGTLAAQVVIQTGTNQSAIICDSSGNTSMKTVAVNALSSSGRVSSNTDLLSAGPIYVGNGNGFVDANGQLYGTAWGGYLSTFLSNTYIQASLLGNNLAQMNVQGIGVYAFLQNTNSAMGIGALAAGGLYYSSHNNVSGTVAPGTWRCMGWANTGGVSVFQRVA